MAAIHRAGYTVLIYIDDILFIASSLELCTEAIKYTVDLLESLGFIIHPSKSILIPTNKIVWLGCLFDSISMTVKLSAARVEKIKDNCRALLSSTSCSIREFSSLIGLFVSACPVCPTGKLHYRIAEREKIRALKSSRGGFDAVMRIPNNARDQIRWWLDNVDNLHRKIGGEPVPIIISTDASMTGWGASSGDYHAHGTWTELEQKDHINLLELKAAFLGLKALHKQIDLYGRKVVVQMDNTTAVAHVNHMGSSRAVAADSLARELWLWAMEREMDLSATYIPGESNVIADTLSRQKFSDAVVWELKQKYFDVLAERWGTPDVDLFASRHNNKLAHYIAWDPDPYAYHTDAFTLKWSGYVYCFPPYKLLAKCIQKIKHDNVSRAIVVAPNWETQSWFATLRHMAIDVVIFRSRTALEGSTPFNFEVQCCLLSNSI